MPSYSDEFKAQVVRYEGNVALLVQQIGSAHEEDTGDSGA